MNTIAERVSTLAEGKTKIIRRTRPGIVHIESKDDLTAGNGKKHDILRGKGVLATNTTCNVFELLRPHGLPLAYMRRTGGRTFQARECSMVPLEIVVRLVVDRYSSYAKRIPGTEGYRFKKPEVEYYLKTTGRRWKHRDGTGILLPVDDPYLVLGQNGTFCAYDPARSTGEQNALLELRLADLGLTADDLAVIESMALRTAEILSNAWEICAGGKLKDLKIEVGWWNLGKFERPTLHIADVIDNDSWRLEIEGKEVSKEVYRQGAPLDEVERCYQLVSDLSASFLDMAA